MFHVPFCNAAYTKTTKYSLYLVYVTFQKKKQKKLIGRVYEVHNPAMLQSSLLVFFCFSIMDC